MVPPMQGLSLSYSSFICEMGTGQSVLFLLPSKVCPHVANQSIVPPPLTLLVVQAANLPTMGRWIIVYSAARGITLKTVDNLQRFSHQTGI